MAVSFILALVLPKPKQKTQKDPTSPNASAGTSIPRIFGTAVVGGIVIDSTTPELENAGGKGVFSGGKKQGDTKTGTFQVLIGEGERPWNYFVLKDDEGPAIQTLIGSSLSTPLTSQKILYGVGLASPPEHRMQAISGYIPTLSGIGPLSQILSFLSNAYTETAGTTSTQAWHAVRASEWVIPASQHQGLTSIQCSFTAKWRPTTGTLFQFRTSTFIIQIAVIQGNFLYFPAIGAGTASYGATETEYAPNGISVTPSNLNNRVDLSQDRFVSTVGLPDLSGNGAPLEVCWFCRIAEDTVAPSAGPGYSAQFAVSRYRLTYTSTGNSGGELDLLAIYMNDELWYDIEATGDKQQEKNSERSKYFSFYSGALNQRQDPSLVALRGIDKVPGYQGYSHIVYSKLPLEDWGNNYPSSKYKVRSTLPATFGTIIRDIMVRCGIIHGKPLLEGKDWAEAASSINGSNLVNTALYSGVFIDGYVLNTDSTELKQALAQFEQMWRFTLAANPNLNSYRNSNSAYTHRLLALYKTIPYNVDNTIDIDAEILGTNDEDSAELPYSIELETTASDDIPGEVEVQYYNNNKGGEREGVIVDRSTFQVASTHTFSSDYFVNGKKTSTANSIAKFLIEQGVRRAKQITTGVFPNLLTGLNTALNWTDRLVMRPQKVMWGDSGLISITGISVNVDNPAGDITEDIVDDLISGDGSQTTTQPQVFWTEGQATLAPATGKLRTIYAWISPTTDGVNVPPSSILISPDGTTFSQTEINSVRRNAQLIIVNNISPTNFVEHKYNNYDTGSTITITVPEGVAPTSASLASVVSGLRNVLWLPNYGFVGFVTATIIAPNQYQLSGIVWNLGQSSIDEPSPPFTTPTLGWYLVGQPYEIEIPSGYAIGSNLTLMAATNTTNGGTYSRPYRGLNSAPRYPVLFNIQYNENSDIEISWCPHISQQTQLIPDLFNDPAQTETENYQVRVYEGGTLKRTASTLLRTFTYSGANQLADGVTNRSALRYEIIHVGSLGQVQQGVVFDKLGSIV